MIKHLDLQKNCHSRQIQKCGFLWCPACSNGQEQLSLEMCSKPGMHRALLVYFLPLFSNHSFRVVSLTLLWLMSSGIPIFDEFGSSVFELIFWPVQRSLAVTFKFNYFLCGKKADLF